MFAKTLVLAALVGVAFAASGDQSCQPICQQTSQRDAFQKADIVARIRVMSQTGGLNAGGAKIQTPAGGQASAGQGGASINAATRRAMNVNGPLGGNAQAQLPQQEPITYTVQIVEQYKPKQMGIQGNQNNAKFIQSGDITCRGLPMLDNQEYLVVGKRNGSNYQVNKCEQIPLNNNVAPTGPVSWLIAQNTLAQGLKDGFQSSGNQQGGLGGGMGGMGGLGAGAQRPRPSPLGAQQPDESSSSSSSSSSQGGQDQSSQQGGQGGQGGQESGSQQFGQGGQDQSSQQGGQSGQDQSSQQQGGQEGSSQQFGQGSQDQSSQQQGGDQSSQQGGQDGQDQSSQQQGSDSQQQGGDSQQQGGDSQQDPEKMKQQQQQQLQDVQAQQQKQLQEASQQGSQGSQQQQSRAMRSDPRGPHMRAYRWE